MRVSLVSTALVQRNARTSLTNRTCPASIQLRAWTWLVGESASFELAGLHRTYLGGIERGERNVSIVNLGAIANALDLKDRRPVRCLE